MIKLFDPGSNYIHNSLAIDKAIKVALIDGHYILGEAVERFESEVSGYLGVKYAIGVANGTDALTITLRALEDRQDYREKSGVIVPDFTFWSTYSAIDSAHLGPCLVDVNVQNGCISTLDVMRFLYQHRDLVRFVIPVHLYGMPVAMGPLKDICDPLGISIIEDCAQAFGASYDSKKVGTIGIAGCFSFFPTKPLGACGDGGMIVTNDQDLAERARMLRTHGWKEKYKPEMFGYNSRLDALQAAILSAKLPNIGHERKRRQAIAHQYDEAFKDKQVIQPILSAPTVDHAYHLYVLRVNPKKREFFRAILRLANIETGVYYPLPIHKTPLLEQSYQGVCFPASEILSESNVAIPCYAELTSFDVEHIINSVLNAANLIGDE